MIDNREALLDELKDILAVYAKRVEMEEGKLSDASESFYCGLLNAMMGGNLKNMNREKPNFPAIDLGDDAPVALDGKAVRLAVQITSTGARQKVRHTLDEFFSNNLHSRFDRLIVLVTGKTETFKEEPKLPVDFDFHSGRDVWSEKKLLDRIRDLSDDRFEAVADYVHKRLTMPESRQRLNLPLQSAMAAENFVGREVELRELAQRFEKDRIVVLSGLGGMGKTELAVKFGREYEKNGGGWVYFVPFRKDFYHTVVDELALGIPGLKDRGLDEKAVYEAAMEVLRGCGAGDLMIVDNADEGSITGLRRELSKLPMRVLVTSRKAVAGAVQVEPLPKGVLYTVFEQNGVSIPRAEMDELIDAVNAHTLTVDVMARTMGRGRRTATASKLLAALKERDLSKGFTKVEIDYAGSPEQARINEHLKAVFRVAELEEESQVILRCATLLPEGGMDDGLFLSPFIEEAGDRLDDLIEGGWLYMKDGLLRIHPVIRIVCVEVLEPTEEKCEDFLSGIWGQYDRKRYDHAKFRQMAELFENADQILDDKTGSCENLAGYLWLTLSETQRALICNLRSMEKMEQNQPDSKNLASSYDNVGYAYGALGDHGKAQEYQLKALEIRERVLPTDHPDLATSYNNMGNTYDDLGDHEKALEYQLKALAIQKRVLPSDHPDLASGYNNVATTYDDLDDHEKALEYHLKALEIRARVLPSDHPDLAQSYANLSYTYGKLGDHEKMLEYNLKALEIRERVLPGNHPSLAMSCNNTAWIYYVLGRIREAADYMRRAAQIINRSSLPENHPDRVNYNKWAEEMEAEAQRREKEGQHDT